jgi:peptidoglycan/xylan/chitin deacetylase (PgdA/CDA1 family)
MQSSADDGDPAAVKFFAIVPLFLLFLSACHKPSKSVATTKPSSTAIAIKAPVVDTIKKKHHKKKKLYITFDDGPNKGTANVLHIIQDENIPVSFFIVGGHVFASIPQEKMWDSLQIAEHIALCNHSFSHAKQHYKQYYETPDSVVADFRRTQDSLRLNNPIARTPGRNIWRIDSLRFTDLESSIAAADSLHNAGFVLMGWDVEWHFDHKTMSVQQTADQLVEEIDSAFAKNNTKRVDHLVLLAHDQVYNKPEDSMQLRQFIQKLKLKDEYELSLVTNYPGALKRMKVDSFPIKSISQ